jgi:tRNA pseudouridine55 synthase
VNEEDLKSLDRSHAEERPNAAPVPKDESGKTPKPKKRDKRDVHGWVVLDKPVGMTSTHAVSVVKRLFSARRAGHAGTLDPLASGALPIALGEATKTVPFVMDGRKLYRFTVRWGEERYRRRGPRRRGQRSETIGRCDPDPLPSFTGCIQQVPPRYSAIKIEGERALRSARDGETVELTARPVEIGGWSSTFPTPTMRSWRPNAARAPMCARLPATWGGHLAALATFAPCGGPRSGRLAKKP